MLLSLGESIPSKCCLVLHKMHLLPLPPYFSARLPDGLQSSPHRQCWGKCLLLFPSLVPPCVRVHGWYAPGNRILDSGFMNTSCNCGRRLLFRSCSGNFLNSSPSGSLHSLHLLVHNVFDSVISVKWYYIVLLICIFLNTNELEHFCICLLFCWDFPCTDCLFPSFDNFPQKFLSFCPDVFCDSLILDSCFSPILHNMNNFSQVILWRWTDSKHNLRILPTSKILLLPNKLMWL